MYSCLSLYQIETYFLIFFYFLYKVSKKGRTICAPKEVFPSIFKAVIIDSLYSCPLFFLFLMVTPSLMFLSVVRFGAFFLTFFFFISFLLITKSMKIETKKCKGKRDSEVDFQHKKLGFSFHFLISLIYKCEGVWFNSCLLNTFSL